MNVAAKQVYMPPRAGSDVRIIVSGGFKDAEKSGAFLDERIQWVKVPDQLNGKRIKLYGYTLSNLFIRPSLSEMFGLTVLEAASRAPVRAAFHRRFRMADIRKTKKCAGAPEGLRAFWTEFFAGCGG